jgi:hypothetical protein
MKKAPGSAIWPARKSRWDKPDIAAATASFLIAIKIRKMPQDLAAYV